MKTFKVTISLSNYQIKELYQLYVFAKGRRTKIDFFAYIHDQLAMFGGDEVSHSADQYPFLNDEEVSDLKRWGFIDEQDST